MVGALFFACHTVALDYSIDNLLETSPEWWAILSMPVVALPLGLAHPDAVALRRLSRGRQGRHAAEAPYDDSALPVFVRGGGSGGAVAAGSADGTVDAPWPRRARARKRVLGNSGFAAYLSVFSGCFAPGPVWWPCPRRFIANRGDARKPCGARGLCCLPPRCANSWCRWGWRGLL